MDTKTMLQLLKISGAAVIVSVFTLNGPILTIALTVFVIAVFVNCLRIFGGRDGIEELLNFSIDKGAELAKPKIQKGKIADGVSKKSKGIMYLIAHSMCLVGVIFTVICLLCMWSMVIKG